MCPKRSDAQSRFRVCSVGPKKSAHVAYPGIGSETWIGRPGFRRKLSNRVLSSISIVRTSIVVDTRKNSGRNPNFPSVHPTPPWRKVVKSSSGFQFYRAHGYSEQFVRKIRFKSCVSSSHGCCRVAHVELKTSVRAQIIGGTFPTPNSHPIHPLGSLSKQKASKQKPRRLSTPEPLRST